MDSIVAGGVPHQPEGPERSGRLAMMADEGLARAIEGMPVVRCRDAGAPAIL